MGLTFKPYVDAEPKMLAFAADQFVEVYPLGRRESPRAVSPFFAMGVEEYGRVKIQPTFHAQAGALVGKPFRDGNFTQFRAALGFYAGADPRLKYMQYKDARARFLYAAIFVDI